HRVWRPGFEPVRRRHELGGAPLAPRGRGPSVVSAAGPRHIVKLNPPFWARPAALELAALGRVRERLGMSTPDPLASGALTAPGAPWPYLVMSRLEGVELARVWASLDPGDQVSIAVRVGEVLARLHAVDARDLA